MYLVRSSSILVVDAFVKRCPTAEFIAFILDRLTISVLSLYLHLPAFARRPFPRLIFSAIEPRSLAEDSSVQDHLEPDMPDSPSGSSSRLPKDEYTPEVSDHTPLDPLRKSTDTAQPEDFDIRTVRDPPPPPDVSLHPASPGLQ